MMKNTQAQQNQAIAQLFESFAESLPSQAHLCEKARNQIVAPRQTAVRTKPRYGWVFAVAACCLVLFVAVLSVLPGTNTPPSDGLPQVTVYASSSVSGTAATDAQAEKYLPISLLKQQFEVVFEKYAVYTFNSNGTFAYFKAILGVVTEFGVVEMEVVAENEKFVHQSRLERYNQNIKYNGSPVINGSYAEQGEYVTQAYATANGANLYFVAQSNPNNSQISQKIAEIFVK
ncbi:MAG: hypothetical protein ACI4QH_04925 [Candidatus Fimimonas sp.]